MSIEDLRVLIKGGGEMASGIAHRLSRCHFKVCITEMPQPRAVRREVSFSEAVYAREKTVEGLTAKLVHAHEEITKAWNNHQVPVIVDPETKIKEWFRPHVLVDATIAKKNLGTNITDAHLVIGLGPGFCAGRDVHLVVETNRGHNLGRIIRQGEAEENTGVPGVIAGFSVQRVLRAPKGGRLSTQKRIGDDVDIGEAVSFVDDIPVKAKIKGVIRGLLRNGSLVSKGMKTGDIDPRGIAEYCYTISDKARAVAGGVLEAILTRFNQ
jgi:xanthine dehydrogenase accessory factor